MKRKVTGMLLHLSSVLAACCLLVGCNAITIKPVGSSEQRVSSEVPTNTKAESQPKETTPAGARHWEDPVIDLNNHRVQGWGLVSMPAMESYLNDLLAKIKAHHGASDTPGRVYIMSDPSLNAHTTGAGNIYINIGWLQEAESEDELVFILAHEFGHVHLGHKLTFGQEAFVNWSSKYSYLGWSLANAGAVSNTFGVSEVIPLVNTVSREIIFPYLKQRNETEADEFGLKTTLALGYAYKKGPKTVMERLSSWEEGFKAQEMERRRKAEAEIVAATNAQLAAIDAQHSGKMVEHKVEKGWHQVDVDLYPILGKPLTRLLGAIQNGADKLKLRTHYAVESMHDDHPDTEKRFEELHALSKELPKSDVVVATPRFDEIRNLAETKESIEHYKKVVQIPALLEQGHAIEALSLAEATTSGATADHAMMLQQLWGAKQLTGGTTDDAVTILGRNLGAKERSWTLQYVLAMQLAKGGKTTEASALVQDGVSYFSRAPAMLPDVIAFYRDIGDMNTAKQYAIECLKVSRDSDICKMALLTMEQQQQVRIAQEKATQQMLDKMGENIKNSLD